MKLELSEAIDLVLSLPAHRSRREAHRKLGNHAFDLLLEYRELGENSEEKAFNREMICAVLATIRAFSIERDLINQEWESIAAIKKRRERLLSVIRNISPFEKGNYWSKILAFLAAFGLAMSRDGKNAREIVTSIDQVIALGIGMLIFILLALEVASKILEFMLGRAFERKHPMKKEEAWRNRSVKRYKEIVCNFIDKSIDLHKQYFTDQRKIHGFDTDKDEELQKLKKYLIKRHFFY